MTAHLESPSVSGDQVSWQGDLLEGLENSPDIVSASVVFRPPIVSGGSLRARVSTESSGESIEESVWEVAVAGAYFETVGLPFLLGRAPAAAERAVVINETLWRTLWPESSPLGRLVGISSPSSGTVDGVPVVGVVQDSTIFFSLTTRAGQGGGQLYSQ